MAYRVSFLPEAEADLAKLYRRLLTEAPIRGPEWFNRLESAIYSLRNNPYRCPVVPDAALSPFEVRHLLHGKKPNVYRILFQIIESQNVVEILHIRHGAMKPIDESS